MDRATEILAFLKNAVALADEAKEYLLAAQIELPISSLEDRIGRSSSDTLPHAIIGQSNGAIFDGLIEKLDRLARLDIADKIAVADLPFRLTHPPAGADLVRAGDIVTECGLLVSGYAFRSKVASNGTRQIVSFHIPGDVLDGQHILLPKADHGVQTLTEATIAWLPIESVKAVIETRPMIGEAVWRDTLIDASIFREWVFNVGRRDAKSRIAHMLCEFAMRRKTAGLGAPEEFALPMNQVHIADATGLTPVHVNRMLAALANDGVIAPDRRKVRIVDWNRMCRIADFASDYLHMAA